MKQYVIPTIICRGHGESSSRWYAGTDEIDILFKVATSEVTKSNINGTFLEQRSSHHILGRYPRSTDMATKFSGAKVHSCATALDHIRNQYCIHLMVWTLRFAKWNWLHFENKIQSDRHLKVQFSFCPNTHLYQGLGRKFAFLEPLRFQHRKSEIYQKISLLFFNSA